MSHHRTREAKALLYIRRHGSASVLEIGTAAVAGENRACLMPRRAKDAIGLSIAVALARRGVIQATRENLFTMAPRTR